MIDTEPAPNCREDQFQVKVRRGIRAIAPTSFPADKAIGLFIDVVYIIVSSKLPCNEKPDETLDPDLLSSDVRIILGHKNSRGVQ